MFTGLISDVGEILSIQAQDQIHRLRIDCSYPLDTIALGASIACNGICMTVVAMGAQQKRSWFDVDAAAETLALTTLRDWKIGRRINLERSLKIGDEMGGHIVTGHVDGIAQIIERDDFEGMARFNVKVPAALAYLIATKGSVCLNGTSLTVNSVKGETFSVLLIPHTLEVTNWSEQCKGSKINIEVDLMARYAARLNESPQKANK